VGHQRRPRTDPGRRGRGLGAGMAAAYHNDIESLGHGLADPENSEIP
jgi:hypothetical protein